LNCLQQEQEVNSHFPPTIGSSSSRFFFPVSFDSLT
jgi:hypothetical protein